MNVGNALKITSLACAAGVLLRVVHMLFYYDYETGFYTNNGLMAWVCTGFVILSSIFLVIMCLMDKGSLAPYTEQKRKGLGVITAISAIVLIASAVFQIKNHSEIIATAQPGTFASPMEIYTVFAVFCAIFGIVQILAAIDFFSGKGILLKAPLIYLLAVLWGLAYLMMIYVFYAKSANFTENFFPIVGGALLLLTVFYICKLFAGVNDKKTSKRVYMFGIPAVIVNISYTLGNLVLLVFNKTYSGEIPAEIQVANLAVSVFALIFLITLKRYGAGKDIAAETTNSTRSARRFK